MFSRNLGIDFGPLALIARTFQCSMGYGGEGCYPSQTFQLLAKRPLINPLKLVLFKHCSFKDAERQC